TRASSPPARTAIYTLSLHDALPIFESQDFKIPQLRNIYEKTAFTVVRPGGQQGQSGNISAFAQKKGFGVLHDGSVSLKEFLAARSEEHTSELQSRGHLVCRLLLEKK